MMMSDRYYYYYYFSAHNAHTENSKSICTHYGMLKPERNACAQLSNIEYIKKKQF